MKSIIPALMIPAVCLSLAADTTGRISLTVNNKAGAPIANAKILLERKDITWTKTLTTNSKGNALQIGLEPKEFNVTITADGYAPMKMERKVPLGDLLSETIVLLTPEEAKAQARANAPQPTPDASADKENAGSKAFNTAVSFYNDQKYVEALPLIEEAYKNLAEAIAAAKDGSTAKTEMQGRLPTVERVYGICLAEAGKGDESKNDQAAKAEPFLVRALERNPKDQRIISALQDVAAAKKDEEMAKKYQAMMDALVGPRPEVAYNEGVSHFNAGHYKEAKTALLRAITIDPKFSNSYYLLGTVEYSLGNNKGAKDAFKKYMEIDPTGPKAGEVKEFLKELK